jgi:Rrf2 family transcriptional regulator, cysteine metabolism repressor
MRISKKAEYALRALGVIARQRTKSWSIQELSDLERIPLKFLEQILLTLRHAGILASKRGVRGGYTLVRMPETIRLGEVIALFDGPLAPVPCAGEKPAQPCTCPDPRTCPLRQMMTGIRNEMAAMLESRTIEDLARLAPATSLAFEI